MSASIAYDPKRLTGFELDQLAAAFDRVRNPRDWKAPIRAVIPTEDRGLVEKAVLWFTDTVPTFVPVPGRSDRLTVTAQGYRMGETESRNGHLREDSQRILATMESASVVAAEPVAGTSVPARPRRRFTPAETEAAGAGAW
jgi:hypothetical protein